MRSSILGNQENRTSKVDTEKWKEHAEYYNNPKNFKKEETSTNENLENKLSYTFENGKPRLELQQMEALIVIPTQAEYDTLMQIYDCAGYQMLGYGSPTERNRWPLYGAKTAITGSQIVIEREEIEGIDVGMAFASIDDMPNSTKITMQEYLKIQGITQDMIEKINEWYDENQRNRASRG